MSSDCEPRYDENGGEEWETGVGFSGGAGFSWGFGVIALGDMYGDCKAETKADEGGDTSGELHGDDSIKFFKFGEVESEFEQPRGVEMFLPILLPEVEILMVRPLRGS